MKLYMKQKVFSWREKFFIKDEEGNDCYTIKGEVFSIGRKLHVTNAAGEEVAFIHQKIPALKPRFFVEINGKEVCEIVREYKLFKQNYRIEGLPWHMEGDFAGHDYNLKSNDGIVMNLTKKWFSWGDSYELDIADPQNAVLCLCIAMAIELVLQEQEEEESDEIEVHNRLNKK